METYNNYDHGGYMVVLSWLLNVMHLVDKSNVSFILSTVCSVLAIVYYTIKIRQESKKKNDVGENDKG